MRHAASRLLMASALAAVALVGSASTTAATVPAVDVPAPVAAAPCGTATTPPAHYQHVIWIWFENHSYRQVIGPPGSTAATNNPYWNSLAAQCGLASGFRSTSHPSLPNYIAATSGGVQGITTDCTPAQCSTSAPSVFGQVTAAGLTWKSYQEGMVGNCRKTNVGEYAARHNPAVYYTAIASQCATQDVPAGTTLAGSLADDLDNDALPAFSFLMPDLCNSTHDCALRTGDAWMQGWMNRILASPGYLAGQTAVFVTWDEGSGGTQGEDCVNNATDQSCHVATLVVSPTTIPGTKRGAVFTHYSLLRTTEQLLGIRTYLGQAATAKSMKAGFGL
jgi:phosphatidylinositol-3-phosphatase